MMMYEWAAKHGISDEAIIDLRKMMGITVAAKPDQLTEAGVQARVRVNFACRGGMMFRNNVGVAHDSETGQIIRYGLANETAHMNKTTKSSDLIGIMPVTITPQMVGGVIGQFVAREVKKSAWTYQGTDRERAQARFLELIIASGGDACFTNGSDL